MNLLDVRDLSVSYTKGDEQIEALVNIDFAIDRGEIVGLIGETGSGKSTMVNAIVHLLPENSRIKKGHVKLSGKDVFSLDPIEVRRLRKSDIGVVAQNPYQALNPTMKVGHQVREVLHDTPKDEARSQILKSFTDLGLAESERVFRSYPHQLSIGQCQRIAVAMALLKTPKLVIADEPTASVDQDTAAKIEHILNQLRQDGISTLLVSHDIGLVSRLCDRWYCLQQGHVIEKGSGPLLSYSGNHPYVLELIERHQLDGSQSTDSSEHLIRVEGLRFKYASKSSLILDIETFSLPSARLIAIVGESGSGKSTFLKIIAGLRQDYVGSVTYRGKEIRDLVKQDRIRYYQEVQYVFQDASASLPPHLTADKIVAAAIRNFATSWTVTELFALVELPESLLTHFPAQLSGGEQQRVSLARALAANPSVLLLDETLSGLDRPIQHKLLRTIKSIQKVRKLTICMVSHDQELVRSFSSTVYKMESNALILRQ